ncbi:MAG TPA: hypothetical protein DCP92_17920 [Nitrospiraceae bacterium]|nr:hypothetical protein [Nitrospiraceae bacterium]
MKKQGFFAEIQAMKPIAYPVGTVMIGAASLPPPVSVRENINIISPINIGIKHILSGHLCFIPSC